ncbi:DegT/DnrJ/EryC1/StrS family aminotransferase [Sulfitobacter albidus]|uniref:DegT/DnrJ/EryC1/StrS family aminotransferase n=1 Tax=Sulfitobacter albidus TaxID=2829501 RepID=A0A975PLS9_9RHOB|nr:DegT/DnrJ/EryC1/StrS family aminotransferase [Sulfitobacter albidus]QUJ76009.1 DegT/DnrJ/EryC1/StrS family aminotransferase [Sulfitobacter albidus]
MKYSFLDVGFTYRTLKDDLDAAYHGLMDSGMYIGGDAVARFEAEFAEYCGAKHCIGVGNGLDALVLTMRAYGIGAGDEVIVPANTFIATWLAVAQVGATPVPVDADPATMNIDLDLVPDAITAQTRAIMPVHLYGQPVACEGLRALARTHDLKIIEDAAQAHGARDGNRRAGQLGDVAGFSFYPGKNLGAFGDGGAIVTDDDALAKSVRILGNYGSEVKYQHDHVGYNSRLDPLQAALLSVKLAKMDEWSTRRSEIADVYQSALAGTSGLTLPVVADGVHSAWHLYVVRTEDRAALQSALAERGVASAMHYPIANHKSGAFEEEFGHMSFPVTEEICRTCLSLPIGPHLSVEQAHEIAGHVKDATRSLA